MRYFFQLPQNKQRYAIDLWRQVGVKEGMQGTPDQVLRFLRLCEDDELAAFYIENIAELMNAGNECMIFDHNREIKRLRTQVRDMVMEKQNGR